MSLTSLHSVFGPEDADSKEYKAALRAVFSLVGVEGGKKKETLTIKEIEQVLSLEVRLTNPLPCTPCSRVFVCGH